MSKKGRKPTGNVHQVNMRLSGSTRRRLRHVYKRDDHKTYDALLYRALDYYEAFEAPEGDRYVRFTGQDLVEGGYGENIDPAEEHYIEPFDRKVQLLEHLWRTASKKQQGEFVAYLRRHHGPEFRHAFKPYRRDR